MSRFASLLPFVLVLAPSLLFGCKKDEPAKPEPSAEATAPVLSASAKSKLSLRNVAPVPKIDPQAMKDYRLEVCYFGTLTLRQARDAYLASLGKDEPSEKKIPNFGLPVAPSPASFTPRTVVLGAPSAGPAPSGSAKALALPMAASAAAGRRVADMGLRAPHERNARACTVAAGLKDPAMPAVDAALAEFAPFALELSRNVAAASIYYQREEYSKDKFEKGKDLHKKLVADFAKLDEMSEKLGTALAAFRKEHPADATKLDPSEKLVVDAYDNARNIVLSVLGAKVDAAAYKTNLESMEKSVEAVKEFGKTNPNDMWAKITAPAFEAFLKSVRDGEGKISDKGLASDAFLQIVNSFTSLIESRHRALSRAMIAKGQTIEPRPGSGPGRPGPKFQLPAKIETHEHEKHDKE